MTSFVVCFSFFLGSGQDTESNLESLLTKLEQIENASQPDRIFRRVTRDPLEGEEAREWKEGEFEFRHLRYHDEKGPCSDVIIVNSTYGAVLRSRDDRSWHCESLAFRNSPDFESIARRTGTARTQLFPISFLDVTLASICRRSDAKLTLNRINEMDELVCIVPKDVEHNGKKLRFTRIEARFDTRSKLPQRVTTWMEVGTKTHHTVREITYSSDVDFDWSRCKWSDVTTNKTLNEVERLPTTYNDKITKNSCYLSAYGIAEPPVKPWLPRMEFLLGGAGLFLIGVSIYLRTTGR